MGFFSLGFFVFYISAIHSVKRDCVTSLKA